MPLPDIARLIRQRTVVEWARGTDADLSAYEDVTDDVLISTLSVAWGRDQARSFAPPKAETLEFALNNQDGTYNNVAGPLATFVNKGPLVYAYATHTSEVTVDSLDVTVDDLDWTVDDPEEYQIFGGQVVRAPQSLEAMKRVQISAIGALRLFTRTKVTLSLLENQTVDQILNYICDAVGFPAANRIFDQGDTIITYFWMHDEVSLPKMVQLLAAEGSNAVLFTDNEGNLRFQGRQYRTENYRSTDIQYYLYDSVDDVAPDGAPDAVLHSPPTTLNQNPDEAYNVVSGHSITRVVAAGLTQVFSAGVLVIGAGETRTIYTDLSVPVKDAVTPTVTTDYLVSSGSVSSITLDRTSGTRIGISITAGGSGAGITGPAGQETEGLKLRAKLVSVLTTVEVRNTVDTSEQIERYEEIPYTVSLWQELSPNTLQDIVNGIATRYSEPRDQLTITVYNTSPISAIFMLRSQISDRINIKSTHQGIDAAYYIETKQMQSVGNGLFMCTLGCEKVIDQDAFRFGIDNFGENVFGE